MKILNSLMLISILLSGCTIAAKPPVQARLLVSHIPPPVGEIFYIGVEFRMQGQWHIYGADPGDSGAPPEFQWQKPEDLELRALPWPPTRIWAQHGLTNNIYSDRAVFVWEARLSQSGSYLLRLDLNWLGCDEVCVPGSTNLSVELITEGDPAETKDAVLLRKASGL